MTSLLGQITITRSRGDVIHIYVEDCTSGCRVIEVTVEPADFARAITGMGFIPCVIEQFNASSKVGRKKEIKTENIRPPEYKVGQTDADFAKILAPFEADGWVGDISTFRNRHNRLEDGSHRVTFRRWLSLPEQRND